MPSSLRASAISLYGAFHWSTALGSFAAALAAGSFFALVPASHAVLEISSPKNLTTASSALRKSSARLLLALTSVSSLSYAYAVYAISAGPARTVRDRQLQKLVALASVSMAVIGASAGLVSRTRSVAEEKKAKDWIPGGWVTAAEEPKHDIRAEMKRWRNFGAALGLMTAAIAGTMAGV